MLVHRKSVVAGIEDRTDIDVGVHDSEECCHSEMLADKMSLPANWAVVKFRYDRAQNEPS